jgi:hypothetical protein
MVRDEWYVYAAEVADIVQACPSIKNLNFAATVNTELGMGEYLLDESYITRIRTLPLRHIHCDLVELIHSAMGQPFKISSFTHLTHLDLLYWFDQAAHSAPEAPKLHTRLRELPQLTHLSVPSHTSNSDPPIPAHLHAYPSGHSSFWRPRRRRRPRR